MEKEIKLGRKTFIVDESIEIQKGDRVYYEGSEEYNVGEPIYWEDGTITTAMNYSTRKPVKKNLGAMPLE